MQHKFWGQRIFHFLREDSNIPNCNYPSEIIRLKSFVNGTRDRTHPRLHTGIRSGHVGSILKEISTEKFSITSLKMNLPKTCNITIPSLLK